MKNTTSKFVWGVFFLGFGLMWIGSNLGILREGAFKGLLISFILILFGVVVILKGRIGNGNDTIEDKSDRDHSEEYSDRKEPGGDYSREARWEEGFTEETSYNSGRNGNTESKRGYAGERNYDGEKSYAGERSYDGEKSYAGGKSYTGKKNYTSILSSHNVQCTEEFTGAEVTAILGGVELDLRNAVITRDIVIDVNCIMGAIDIFLPTGVKVSISCVPIMGGVESRINGSANRKESMFTVYIRGTCLMGGIEIK